MSDTLKTPAMRLDGLVSVVTGAGRGLGRGAAIALADAGSEVVLVSRTGSDLDSVKAEIEAKGGTAMALICDVADIAQVQERIGGLARIDVLVNNAGMTIPQPFVEITEEAFDQIAALNIKGALFTAQAAARRMQAGGRGGAIVNMSSQFGHVAAPGRAVYGLTKYALEGMTKTMAIELAPDDIRVNAICPTYIETPLTTPILADPAVRKDAEERIPLGRIGEIEDVMGAILFLASPAARMITGSSLLIDGGWTAR